jgi:hypothetical protein
MCGGFFFLSSFATLVLFCGHSLFCLLLPSRRARAGYTNFRSGPTLMKHPVDSPGTGGND